MTLDMRPTFVLTFDFEDWHQLVYRRLGRPDWRAGGAEFDEHVSTLLAFLDDLGIHATFFVAGVAAERHPRALQGVVASGHDLACHGYVHRRAFQQTPAEFREDVVRCMHVVGDLCGVELTGYRAPWFSITRDSLWAYEILAELGFGYDSSLYDSPFVPRRITPFPRRPFAVHDDLWAYPIAVARWGRTTLPVGGGAYWRALPRSVLWRCLDSVARVSPSPVLYFHTYEWANEALRVTLPTGASSRERARETARRVYKNARRSLIPVRLREAALRYRLVSFRDIVDADRDDINTPLLRAAR
jgi:polysaccharide deacetylase family protein (PEP-CTERM system associated)